ncbi:MAG: NDP-sugar synthase [Prevotella sp.]|nr:NDP-sugar synthase [Prevotella sp.]
MNFGVIAAGEGSRLLQEGVKVPKPLVKIGGEPLVDRLLRIFTASEPANTVVICNDLHEETIRHLRQYAAKNALQTMPFQLVVKTTPSSMHSLYAISSYLTGDIFCVTTVDTVFQEERFTAYVDVLKECVSNGYDGLMGVTDYIDDEKPLYVETDTDMNIVSFLDSPPPSCQYVSAGIYGLTPKSLAVLRDCIARGDQRMRNYQRALLRAGLRLKAYPMGKVMDIDHLTDIEKAENFLADGE